MEFSTSRLGYSPDLCVVSSGYPPSSLSLEHIFPSSSFETRTSDSETLLSLPDEVMAYTTTMKSTAQTDAIQMPPLQNPLPDSFTEFNQAPVSLSSSSSESLSASLSTPSCLSTATSPSLEDWITEIGSDFDGFVTTAPDLSFSFALPPLQTLPPQHVTAFPTGNSTLSCEGDFQDMHLVGSAATFMVSKASSNSLAPVAVDMSARPTNSSYNAPSLRGNVNNSPRALQPPFCDSLSFSGLSSPVDRTRSKNGKKIYGLLSSKCRNSSSLESQLEFLAQHQSPLLNGINNNNDELILEGQAQVKRDSRDTREASTSNNIGVFNLATVKETKRRKSRFLGLGRHQNTMSFHEGVSNQYAAQVQGPRQPRLSTSSLVDRASNIIFNSLRPSNHGSEPVDDASGKKAWADPTLVNNTAPSTSGPRVKPSRSLFNLFS